MQEEIICAGVRRSGAWSLPAGGPDESRDDVVKESRDIAMMSERVAWDDTSRLLKDTRASFHRENRKRGRA